MKSLRSRSSTCHKFFTLLAASLAFFFVSPKVQAQTKNPISWKTDRVSLSADDFSFTANGKIYYANVPGLKIDSDLGSPSYTDLELEWEENGAPMRIYMYFKVENGQWWVTELRTYNGKNPGDWIWYDGFGKTPLGNAFSASSLNLVSKPDPWNPRNNDAGTIHFENLHLTANFVAQGYSIQIDQPNGSEQLVAGSISPIHWTFHTPGRTDHPFPFSTNILLQSANGAGTGPVMTLVDHKELSTFGDNSYLWQVPNLPGKYRISIKLNTPFSDDHGGTSYPQDQSDGDFQILPAVNIWPSPIISPQPVKPTSALTPWASPSPIVTGSRVQINPRPTMPLDKVVVGRNPVNPEGELSPTPTLIPTPSVTLGDHASLPLPDAIASFIRDFWQSIAASFHF